uniref:Large ribosomal subunit protein bL27m n=1 Tax=Blastobotrys adeninivorans TaxID=409370 RepID=A0A060T5B3_BLAAD
MHRFSGIARQAGHLWSSVALRTSSERVPTLVSLTFVRTATKRAAGSRTNMKDSAGRRLGAKRGDGQLVKVGEIVYRQRGTKIYPGENMGIGRDHTLFALEPGYVRYYYDPFHPKRKFAGIALEKDARLPTPHFTPRPRRFGYEPILDPVKAEMEKNATSRKEYLLTPTLKKQLEEREAKRESRRQGFAAKLDELVPGLSESDKHTASSRLVTIQNYLLGGRSLEQARTFTDADYEQSMQLAHEYGKDEQALDKLAAYKEVAKKVDGATSFGPEKDLIKYYSPEELSAMAEQTIKDVKQMVDGAEEMTNELREKVRLAFKKPCFDLSTRLRLYRKYSFKPRKPVELTKQQAEELAKRGEAGKVISYWDHELRKVKRILVGSKAAAAASSSSA